MAALVASRALNRGALALFPPLAGSLPSRLYRSYASWGSARDCGAPPASSRWRSRRGLSKAAIALAASAAASAGLAASSSSAENTSDDAENGLLRKEEEERRPVAFSSGTDVTDLSSLWQYYVRRYTKPVLAIIAINAVVFIAWVVATRGMNVRLADMLVRHGLSSPVALVFRPWTMLTAAFSHKSLWHFVFNMYAFSTIGPMVSYMMGSERFTLFYCGSAITSSLLGIVFQVISRSPVPSLGASGAIIACFAIFAHILPQSQFFFIFFPFAHFDAESLFKGLIVFDLAGLSYTLFRAWSGLRGSFIDHAAHLGGALTGYLYFHYVMANDGAMMERINALRNRMMRTRE